MDRARAASLNHINSLLRRPSRAGGREGGGREGGRERQQTRVNIVTIGFFFSLPPSLPPSLLTHYSFFPLS